MLDLDQWHKRFQEQARWSAALREFLCSKYDLNQCRNILEVGCGTGAVLEEWSARKGSSGHLWGVDLDYARVDFARRSMTPGRFVCGDGYSLPFMSGSIDLVFCHYLLLWLKEPEKALKDMLRVAKPGGWIITFAEPDHVARIDWPELFVDTGVQQTESLAKQGIDAKMGRKVASCFNQVGIEVIEAGIIGAQWAPVFEKTSYSTEWLVYQDDLKVGDTEISQLQQADQMARSVGVRVEFIPTFYVVGRKLG